MSANEEPFTFGLWIQLPPLTLLKSEGIMTVVAEILKAAAARGDTKIVVALAKWTEDPFKSLLHIHQIPLELVEIVTSRQRLPLLVRLRVFLQTRPKAPTRASWFRRMTRALRGIAFVPFLEKRISVAARAWFRGILATDSTLVFGTVSFLALLLLLVLGPPLLLLWGLGKLFLFNSLVERLSTRLQPLYRRCIANKILLLRSRWGRCLTWAHNAVMEDEFRLLARVVSARKDVAVWYVPHPAALQALEIGRPLVVAVPDLVYLDFPTVFDADTFNAIDNRIRKVVSNANAIVTYSEYVRRQHVLRGQERLIGSTHVIPHAGMDLEPVLNDVSQQFNGGSRKAALAAIHDFVRNEYRPSFSSEYVPADYLLDFPFDEVDYLYVSSQIRPHKNYFNLFRAFEILLRRKRLNLKLFFTGRMKLETPETIVLREFVRSAHLELDIVSIPDVPPKVHAAFYHLAKLTVVPTLFEGGFPFPFTESLSVNTPVVMSSIPVTRQTLPADLAKSTLFDPYDVCDMAERIAWGVSHCQHLLERQKAFYTQLRGRTWDLVLEEYLNVFHHVIEGQAGDKTSSDYSQRVRAA
jgi:glycosyltransferase involved in cell wall biosynthesis